MLCCSAAGLCPSMASVPLISSLLFSAGAVPTTTPRRVPAFEHHAALLLPPRPLLFHNHDSPSSRSSRVGSAGFCRRRGSPVFCSAAGKPSPDASSTAKIRSEVLSPFRSLRMFFYIAFIASAGLGSLIATTQLIATLTNPLRSAEVPEILKDLGIDLGAVFIFAFLYIRENKAKNAQVARLSREESLSNLKLRIDENKVISLSSLRGIARLVILAGPASYIAESFERSKPFTESLVERGVLVVPFATDGNSPTFEYDGISQEPNFDKKKRLWQLSPVYTSEWSKWLDEQKALAKIPPENPVYLSLRMDGRVRGSGVGFPPWNAFVAQLPPVKGLWSGLLDGMDGRVL